MFFNNDDNFVREKVFEVCRTTKSIGVEISCDFVRNLLQAESKSAKREDLFTEDNVKLICQLLEVEYSCK